MKFEGTLTRWNEDRGYGYITPDLGGEEIFAHISAWPRDTHAPQVSERLSFDVEAGPQGRKQALHIQRLKMRVEPPLRKPGRGAALPQRSRSLGLAACATLFCAIGAVAAYRMAPHVHALNSRSVAEAAPEAETSKATENRNEAARTTSRNKRNTHRPPDQLISQNEVAPASNAPSLTDPSAINPGADALLKSATPSGKL